MPMNNNMNVNSISSNSNELFLWPQPTSSYNIDESQIVDNTLIKKKSNSHINTYSLNQLTYLDNFNQINSQTLNSSIVLTQENITAPDKDGKRFKCRKFQIKFKCNFYFF